MENKKYFVEMITWKDITALFGSSVNEDFDCLRYTTVGIILEETKDYVKMVSQWGEENSSKNFIIKIPKAIIVERVKFRKVGKSA